MLTVRKGDRVHRERVRTAGWVMIVYASMLHILWAWIIVAAPGTWMTTPLYGLYVASFESSHLLALSLVLSALLAVLGGWFVPSLTGLSLMLPQQFLLFISAYGALSASYAGTYPDNTLRLWSFILADQLPVILAAPLYTVAVLACHDPTLTPWSGHEPQA